MGRLAKFHIPQNTAVLGYRPMGKLPPHEDLVRTGHVLRGVGDLGGRYAQLVGCTQRPVWITQCGAANLHGIGFAMGQNLGRLLRLGDKTHRGHRNIGLGLDLLGTAPDSSA
mgnify:CR=1 FL=1